MNPSIFITHLLSALLVGFVPLLALAAGFWALTPLRRRWGLEGRPSLALSLALGWGILSHLTWLLGALGSLAGRNLYSKWVPWTLILAALLAYRKWGGELTEEVRLRIARLREAAGRYSPLQWLAVAAGTLLAAVLAARLLLMALTPSFFYDVLEYHLPAVRSALATGSLAPIPGNAYTHMPQGAEMLFLLGRLFETDGLGPFAPKLVNLYLALSTAILVNVMARKFGIPPWLRYLAVLTFLCHPITAALLIDGFVGMATALYATAALICWLRARRLPNRLDPPLAAVFLGLAFSCKYPAVGVVILPFLFLLVPLLPKEALPERLAKAKAWIRIPLAVCFMGILVGATYSPWLLRSLAHDGSPFPPLTGKWFGAPPTPGQEAIAQFMSDSHRMESPLTERCLRSAAGRASEPGLLLAVPVLFFLLSPHSDRRRRGLAALALTGYLVWNCVPHGANRFLAPLLPALAVMGVLLVHDLKRWLPHLYFLTALPLIVWVGLLVFDQFRVTALSEPSRAQVRYALGGSSKEYYLEKQLGLTGTFFNVLNVSLKKRPGAKVLMLYEARAAAVAPEAEVVCNTVFDPSPLWEILRAPGGDDPAKVLERLKKEGFTHLAVNEIELARLLGTYPAPAARKDPNYERAENQESPMASFNPFLLPFRRYYPPYHYFSSDGKTGAVETRLDRFIDHILRSRQPIWGQNVYGANIWIAVL